MIGGRKGLIDRLRLASGAAIREGWASLRRGWRDAGAGLKRKRTQADADREDAAKAKRERKNAKRLRDFMSCHERGIWRRNAPNCHPWGMPDGR